MEQAPTPYAGVTLDNMVEPLANPAGQVLYGDRVANTLSALCVLTNALPWTDAGIVACLARVREQLLARGSESPPQRPKDNLLWGKLGLHPFHAGLVRGPHERDAELDILRLIVFTAWARVLSKQVDTTRTGRPRIGVSRVAVALRLIRPSEEAWPIHREIATTLLHRLTTGEGSIDIRPDYPQSITSAMDAAQIAPLKPALAALQVLIAVVFDAATEPKGRNEERDSFDDDHCPIQELLPLTQPEDDSGADAHDRGTPRTWVEAVDEGDDGVAQRSFWTDAQEAKALWLRNFCFPGSSRVLSVPEARPVFDFLLKAAADLNPHRADAALCLLLSGVTSRHARDVTAAQWGNWGAPVPGLRFDSQGRGWFCFRRRAEGLWSRIPQAQMRGHVYDLASDHLWMGLPAPLAPLVRARRDGTLGCTSLSPTRRKKYVFAEPYTALLPHMRQLCQEMRKQISVRVTQGRIRTLLPSFLIEHRHDVPLAQIVSGNALGYSAADLAYEVFLLRHIIEDYTTFSLVVFDAPLEPLPPGADQGLFAVSHNGRLNAVHAKSLIRQLVDRTRNAIPKRWAVDPDRQLQQRLDALQASSNYTFSLLAAAQGHRVFDSTADARIFHFHLRRQIAAVMDKEPDTLHIWRTTALCDLACGQVEAHLEALDDCLRWLQASGVQLPGPKRQLVKVLSGALDGSAPIYVVRDGDVGLRPGTSALLWPEEFGGLPRNFLRHQLARVLREMRVDPLDIGVQLGHFFGRSPYGDDSLDTPLLHQRRMSPRLQSYLGASGWAVLRTPAAKCGEYRRHWLPDWDGWSKLQTLRSQYQAAYRANRKEVYALVKSEKSRVEACIDSAIKDQVATYENPLAPPTDITIDKDQLGRLVQAVLVALPRDPKYKEIGIRALRKRLLRLRNKHAWKASLPPKRVELPPEFPDVTPYHLRAHADIEKMRKILYSDHLDKSLKNSWPEQLGSVAAYTPVDLAVAVLFIDCGLTDTSMLLRAVQSLGAPTSFSTAHHLLVLELAPDANLDDEAREDDATIVTNFRGAALPVSGRAAGALLLARDYIRAQTAQHDGVALPTSDADVLQSLNAVLPTRLRRNGRVALLKYQRAVDMASRVERAGPLMLATTKKVAAPLTPQQFRSAMLNDHAAKRRTLPGHSTDAIESEPARLIDDRDAHDYKQLLTLLRQFNKARRRSQRHVLMYGRTIPPGDADIHAGDAVVEPNLLSLSRSANANTAALAAYALHTVQRRKHGPKNDMDDDDEGDGELRKDERLRSGSVYKYINTFATPLLRSLRGRPVTSLDEDTLEEVFIQTAKSKPVKTMGYALEQLEDFYRFLRREGSLKPRVSFANIADELPIFTRYCEPSFVSQQQYLDTDAQLLAWLELARRKHGPKSLLERCIQAARIALHLMYWCGLRIGEVRRLRFCDVVEIGGHLYLWIRTTRLGEPKSHAGTRFLHISRLIASEAALSAFREWMRYEKVLQGLPEPRNAIFAQPWDRQEPMPADSFGRLLSIALKIGIGNDHARPQWLRHTAIMRWMAPHLQCRAVGGLSGVFLASPESSPYIDGMRISHDAGQAGLDVGLANYEHLRWLAVAERQLADLEGLGDARFAEAFCISEDLLRQYRRVRVRNGIRPATADLVAAILRNRVKSEAPSAKRFWPVRNLPLTKPRKPTIGLASMISLIGDLQQSLVWDAISHRMGLSEDTGRRLFEAIWQVQSVTGYWLVPATRLNALKVACGDRNDRVLAKCDAPAADRVQLGPLEKLLQGADRKLSRIDWSTRKAIQSALLLFRYHEDDSGFSVSSDEEAANLVRALRFIGIPAEDIRDRSYVARHAWCALLCTHCLLIIRHR